MTAIVNCQSYMALNVKDLDAAVADAQDVMGLRLVERTDNRALLTSNARHAEMVLHRAGENSARCVGLEAPGAAAVDEAIARLRREGLAILSERPSLPCIERAVTFATREGHVIEVHTPMPADQPRRYAGPGIHPRRIDHCNLTCSDPQQVYGELNRTIGLKLTERTGGCELMWLRAGDGRHHTVGLAKGRTGLHHLCWEFAQFTDFMRLGDVLDAHDRLLVWGPGRHGAGDNLFAYYVDPAGFLIECSAEMEVIDDANGFEPRVTDIPPDLSNPKVVNRWGALPPLAWIQHHSDFAKVEQATALAS
jgi:catechol 2,3-dioxygenase-like lactoylglutathione lyase family enzyme